METNNKCKTCENYDKEKQKCKLNNNCNNTDFSKCDDYLIDSKLVHF